LREEATVAKERLYRWPADVEPEIRNGGTAYYVVQFLLEYNNDEHYWKTGIEEEARQFAKKFRKATIRRYEAKYTGKMTFEVLK
jgi:hypothetical protein